jgi:hypothetical protein
LIKSIAIDVLSVCLVAAAVFTEPVYLDIAVYIYTGLMVLARLVTLLSNNFRQITDKKKSESPLWIYHLIYFLNTALLLYSGWWITSAGWVFIWVAATFSNKKS